MSRTGIKIVLITLLLFASSSFISLNAQVIITAPSLSVTATCTFPTPYSTLGDILITESAPTDFAIQTSKTLILNAPPNFSFNAGIGSVSVTGTDITGISVNVTASKITITITATANISLDELTVSGIRVRGNNSPNGPVTIKRDAASTAVIAGEVANEDHASLTSIARDPNINVQPVLSNPCEFSSAQFGVSTIVPPISYQWQEDQGSGFVNLVNAPPYSNVNSFQVTIANAPVSMDGFQYRCILTGTDDICTSNAAFLLINTPPVITSDPSDKTVCEGSNTSFSVSATGTALTYSWEVSTDNGFSFNPVVLLPPYSVSTNLLIITNAPASFHNNQYQCTVGGACDPQPVTSISAGILTVNPKPVVITVNDTVCSPATVDLTSAAITSGSTPGLNYTYFTDSTALLPYVTPATAGAGTYYIVGRVPATGCSDTTAVRITVNPKPDVFTTNPAAVCSPDTVDITLPAITATSTFGLNFTYFTDAAATAGYFTPTKADSGTYYIVGILPLTGCSDTTAVTVTRYPKPTVVTVNQNICLPETADLTLSSVTTGSTAGLTFTYFTDAGATATYATPAAADTGTYYIVGEIPATGCTDTTVVTVAANPKPDVFTTDPAAVCAPATIDLTQPAVTATSTFGLNFFYFTDAPATLTYATPATADSGTYYIVGVLPATGCSDTTAVTATVEPKPDLLTTPPTAVCSPATVDITQISVTAGSTPGLSLSYFTDPNATLGYGTPAAADSGTYYIVGLIVATGCSDTTAVTATVNPKPDVFTTNPAAICQPLTSDLTLPAVTVTSTTGLTFSYFTDAGANFPYATPATADSGTYYILGEILATGCSDTTAVTVTINPKPDLLTTAPVTVCSPAKADLTLPSVTFGSTPGFSYSYFTDAPATLPYATPATADSGTYYIVGVLPGAGCADTTPVLVTVNPKPSVITNNPAAVCSPATEDLTLPAVTAGSTAGLTFNYFTDAAATTHMTDSTSAGAGTYYIVGTVPATGCSDTTAVTVTTNPKPTLVTNDPAAICAPATVDLTLPAVTAGSSPGLNLNYFTDAAATIHIPDSSAVVLSGIYYIVGTETLNGCSDTTAVTVSVNAIAVGGTVISDALVCSGFNSDTLTLTGYSGTIQKWQYTVDNGTTWIDIANTTPKHLYTNLTVTTWFRVMMTALCASATSVEARITVDSSPLPVGGIVSFNDTVCSGANYDTLTLTGHSGNIARWEYSIDGGNTWVYINNTTTSLIYNNLVSTTIYHAIIQNSACGSAISSNDTITVTPVSDAGIVSSAAPGCAYSNGGTLTLNGYSGTVVNWQYSMNFGTSWLDTSITAATLIYANLPDTTLYRAIVQNGICPADTSAATIIIINPKPLASFTAGSACLGGITSFSNTSSIESGFIQFNQWDFGDNSSSLSVNPTHIFAQAGANTVNLITISNFGCLDTATVGITVVPLPDAQINADGPLSFCCGGSVSLSAPPGLTYLWSAGSETTESIVVNNCLQSGIYALTVTDIATLCSNSSSVTVTISPIPVANAGNDTTINFGSSFQLSAQGGIVYSWSPSAGLSNPYISSPIANPEISTTYVLTIADINGCSDTDSLTITVIGDINVEITNLLTTNGDGYNDKWYVKNVENYPGTEAIVVNREGQQVYYSTSYDNSWEGLNKNGKPLPDGTYYYFIKFKNSDKVYKGPLTILNEK